MVRKRVIGWVTFGDGPYVLAEEYADMGASRASGVVRANNGQLFASITHRRRGAGGYGRPLTGFYSAATPRLSLESHDA